MKERPLIILMAAFAAVWALLLITFYAMRVEVMAIDHIGYPLIDELLRDLAALVTLLIWIIAFYIIRNYVSRELRLTG